jgi:hypothetical protein
MDEVSRIALLRNWESPILLGEEREEEEEEEGGAVGAGGVHWQRERAFLFQVPLKTTLLHGRVGLGGSHPIMNEWGGARAIPR